MIVREKPLTHRLRRSPLRWALWYAQIFLLLCELETFTELLKALQAM